MKKDHRKEMIAPIVVTILVLVYYVVYFGLILSLIESGVLKLLLGLIPLALGTVMIMVCIQRIREIRSGEEDDLENY